MKTALTKHTEAMTIPSEFEEIRPYQPEELPAVFEELIADPQFQKVVATVLPQMTLEQFAATLRQCKTNLEVQKTFFYKLIKQIEDNLTTGTDLDSSALNPSQRYTFISNHRDIVLDSAILSKELITNGFSTTVEIAIGDNLLIYPWIKKLVRINKSFIVQRSASLRQMLASSARMSRYMHYAIGVKKENIWIAQREGRAKDSDDRTQDSVLKMMAMGGKESGILERLKALSIVPLSISYEYDPCDYLKAKEFQQKRDDSSFKKSREDDLLNMQTGIFGFKGRVHYHAAPCINAWLDTLNENMPKQELFDRIARHIDHEIYMGYRLYACNYVAADALRPSEKYKEGYTNDDKMRFDNYISQQLAKIVLPEKDGAYLRERLLTMYANPLFNQESAMQAI